MSTVTRGRVITAHEDQADAVVVTDGAEIVAVRAPIAGDPAATDDLLLPGLIDLHCHGGGGYSLTQPDAEAITLAADHHRQHGTTSLVASTVTDTPEVLLATVSALADSVDAGALVGIHLEGPFLAAQRCGAQDPELLLPADAGLTRELIAAGRGHIRVMTIAPELPGMNQVLDALAEAGAIGAVGHTAASYEQAREAMRHPAVQLVTHLFNGMAPAHHRDPGPVLAALDAAQAGDVVVELIGDGVHLVDATTATCLRLVPGAAALVTDAMAAAGMPDGDFQLGPQRVVVAEGVARLAAHDDGTPGSIAGGTSRLLDIVARQVDAGVDPRVAVAAATAVPARVLGLTDRGDLSAGMRADLVVCKAGGELIAVMAEGEWTRGSRPNG